MTTDSRDRIGLVQNAWRLARLVAVPLILSACSDNTGPDQELEVTSAVVLERASGTEVVHTHGSGAGMTWHGRIHLHPGDQKAYTVRLITRDGEAVPLGSEYTIHANLASGAPSGVATLAPHGDHVDVSAVGVGTVGVVLVLRRGNVTLWESPALTVEVVDHDDHDDHADPDDIAVIRLDRRDGSGHVAHTHGTGAGMHWHGRLALPLGEEVELDLTFLDADGDTLQFFPGEFTLGAALAPGSTAGVIDIDVHGDHLEVVASSVGQVQLIFSILHGDHSDFDAPPLEVEVTDPTVLDISKLTGTVAYVCEYNDGDNDELCLMGANGAGSRRITENDGPDRAPTWSPDGARLVFNSRRAPHADRPQIYVYDVATSGVTRVSDGPLEDQRASWTPNGAEVVFQRGNFTIGYELFRQHIANGALVQLTDNAGKINAAGSYSPDGTRLVLQSNRDVAGLFPFSTYLIDVATSAVTRLAAGVTDSHDGPRWSPDGQRIVLAAGGDLYIVTVATGAVTQVTSDGFSDSSPDWSPDGKMLVFQSDRMGEDKTSIHVIELETGAIGTLGEGRTPVWTARTSN